MTESDDVRERAESLIARASADETLLEQLRSDPGAVLSAEGFSGEALDTLSSEISGADVQGFRRCDRYTCIVSICGNWEIGNATN